MLTTHFSSQISRSKADTKTKTIILHIGCEKTGSSAIQAYCARNKEWLQSQGIDYPLIGVLPQHVTINAALGSKNPRKIHREIKKIRDQINSSPCNTIVFSHESLHMRSPQVFKDMFSGYNTLIVAYLRNPAQAAISHFATMARFGMLPMGMLDQSVRVYSRTLMSAFDYYWNLEAFASAFGHENMAVRLYDRDALVGHQTVTDFMHLLQVEDVQKSMWPNAKANLSLDADQFVYALRVAQILNSLPKHRANRITVQVCDELINNTKPDPSRPIETLLKPSLKRKINRYFEPNLKNLYHRFFEGKEVFNVLPDSPYEPFELNPKRQAKFNKTIRKSKILKESCPDFLFENDFIQLDKSK